MSSLAAILQVTTGKRFFVSIIHFEPNKKGLDFGGQIHCLPLK